MDSELGTATLTRLSWVTILVGISLIALALFPLRITHTSGYGW